MNLSRLLLVNVVLVYAVPGSMTVLTWFPIAIQRAVVSPDGNFVAVIVPQLEIHIISLSEVCSGSRVVKRIVLPKPTRNFLTQAHMLRWSPETMLLPEDVLTNTTSEILFGSTWLMLSDGNRLIALSTEIRTSRQIDRDYGDSGSESSNILADYELGTQFGRISSIEFVFSHRHALLLFEFNSHASIISLIRPQRDDVQNPKFPDPRTFSQSSNHLYFSVLTRSRGQDQITIFSPSDDTSDRAMTFSPHTLDAQGMQWSPMGEPLLVVWDSASYGFRILFFTALGHHLRQLDLTWTSPTHLSDLAFDDLGVQKLDWVRRKDKSLLAIAAGQKQALICEQESRTNAPKVLVNYDHPDLIDIATCPVWQESTTMDRTFTSPSNAFEAASITESVLGIDCIEVNAECSMTASRDATRPKIVWIWHKFSDIPQTIITFRENVKQILWHPSRSDILLIVTNQRDPVIYAWHDPAGPPAITYLPLRSTGKFEGCWLPNNIGGRHPFMLNSPEAFEIGLLENRHGQVQFKSILRQDFLTDPPPENLDIQYPTPTRSGRKVTIDVPHDSNADKDDPIHSGARGFNW